MVAVLADTARITTADRRLAPTGPSAPPSLRPMPIRSAPRPTGAALRRRRIVAGGLLAALTMCSWISLQAALGRIGGGPLATTDAPGGLQSAGARVWIVRPGDTLWSIAQAVDPGGDVRPLVDRLVAEIRGPAVYPGQTISIPAG